MLGVQPRDIDYVVVGSTPAEMTQLGYTPVGADFPVFLHPETHAEYALARTERKSGKRHQDFVFHASPAVTLEEDLLRRDFTINAMAEDDSGQVIDPHGGRSDLSRRILRHVSPAFTEDPLRVLRAARYASSLNFTITPVTHELLCTMVADGELTHLSVERIWQELSRGLASNAPVRYLGLMRDFGALAVILPEIEALFDVEQDKENHPEGCAGVHTMLVLGNAAANWWPLDVRFACLLHDTGKALTEQADLPYHPGHEERSAELAQAVCTRLRVPTKMTKLVVVAAREHGNVHRIAKLDAAARVDLLGRIGAWQDISCLNCLLAVASCDTATHPSRNRYHQHPNRPQLLKAYQAALQADVASAAQQAPDDPGTAVRAARIASVAAAMEQEKSS